MSTSNSLRTEGRLLSLDAYRGLVMLLMASSGFAIGKTIAKHPGALTRTDLSQAATSSQQLWETLQYQFSHVAWTGCSLWDLIQPSFMFMVGVSLPFSFARRKGMGHSAPLRMLHVIWRSLVLIALGVFLGSQSAAGTQFNFVNVLTQIGLGYTFLYVLVNRHFILQLLAVVAILGGYWTFFYKYEISPAERQAVTTYITEERGLPDSEWQQFDGIAAHWNKHLNAAAHVDRDVLNRFPRTEPKWNGKRFWINSGGYQTLNFIPSLATMIFGLMAGQLLYSERTAKQKLSRLMLGGLLCFAVSMAMDTSIWPIALEGGWSWSPIVKRIWSPGWALFSTGWTLWILAGFYAVIDVWGWKFWAAPLVVVGMNSIAMYLMAQTIKPWIGRMLKTHLATLDQLCGWSQGCVYHLFSPDYLYADILRSVATVFVMFLVCLWLYSRRIFIRI